MNLVNDFTQTSALVSSSIFDTAKNTWLCSMKVPPMFADSAKRSRPTRASSAISVGQMDEIPLEILQNKVMLNPWSCTKRTSISFSSKHFFLRMASSWIWWHCNFRPPAAIQPANLSPKHSQCKPQRKSLQLKFKCNKFNKCHLFGGCSFYLIGSSGFISLTLMRHTPHTCKSARATYAQSRMKEFLPLFCIIRNVGDMHGSTVLLLQSRMARSEIWMTHGGHGENGKSRQLKTWLGWTTDVARIVKVLSHTKLPSSLLLSCLWQVGGFNLRSKTLSSSRGEFSIHSPSPPAPSSSPLRAPAAKLAVPESLFHELPKGHSEYQMEVQTQANHH